MLGHALRALVPGSHVPHYDLADCRTPEAQQEVLGHLEDSDILITAGAPAEFGPLHDPVLAGRVKALHQFPSVSFGGFHPDTVHIPLPDGHTLHGPTGQYHSRLALGAYLSGFSAGEAELLFNRRVFSRLGYLGAFALESALMTRLYAGYGIDLTEALERWRARGVFMHSVNHPHPFVMVDLAVLIARRLGLMQPGGWPDWLVVDDNLRLHPRHPVLPPLAKELGVEGETGFHIGGARVAENSLSLGQFLTAEYAAFQTQPHEVLRGAEGLDAVMTLLA
jgi:hypothetical protein